MSAKCRASRYAHKSLLNWRLVIDHSKQHADLCSTQVAILVDCLASTQVMRGCQAGI